MVVSKQVDIVKPLGHSLVSKYFIFKEYETL